MGRLLPFLAAAVTLAACVGAPPPHPRAVEANALCARYITMGDLGRAEIHCDLGIQFSPQFHELWVNKGLIALGRGQKDVAKDHFIHAVRLNQNSAQAFNNLCFLYLSDRDYGKAHDNCQRALKVNPDYLQARNNLALAYVGLNEREKARKEFRTLTEIDSRVAAPWFRLGLLDLEDKQFERAVVSFQQAVQLDTGFAEAWNGLGMAFAELGKFAESKDAFTACLEANPEHAECRSNAAIVNRKGALLEPTLKETEETLKGENTAASMYSLGRSYKDRGLKHEEERAYRRCLRLDDRFPPCHYGLYEVFREDRREKDARAACRNFLKVGTREEFPREVEDCEKYLGASE